MPTTKHKSHKGLLKRIRITATGKVKHRRRGKSHLNSGFTGAQNRDKRRPIYVHKSVAKKLERVLRRRLRGAEQQEIAR